jgi:hypothetical protein
MEELDVLEMVVLLFHFVVKMNTVLERYSKLIKVDVKTVSDHPYPWHSGNPETAPGGSTKPKIQTSGGAP